MSDSFPRRGYCCGNQRFGAQVSYGIRSLSLCLISASQTNSDPLLVKFLAVPRPTRVLLALRCNRAIRWARAWSLFPLRRYLYAFRRARLPLSIRNVGRSNEVLNTDTMVAGCLNSV